MKPIDQMTDAELQAEWMACEQYINDPDEDNPERFDQAYGRQQQIEYEQAMREEMRIYHEQQGYEE